MAAETDGLAFQKLGQVLTLLGEVEYVPNAKPEHWSQGVKEAEDSVRWLMLALLSRDGKVDL